MSDEAKIKRVREMRDFARRNGLIHIDVLTVDLTAIVDENDRLRARVAELEAENAALKRSAAMACEQPCGSCAGCLYADEVHAREDAQGQEVNKR